MSKRERHPDLENLTRRGRTYWVQMAVPAEVVPAIGKTMLRHCLKTSDLKLASEEKGEWVSKFRRMIRAARTGSPVASDGPKLDLIEAQAWAIRTADLEDKELIAGEIAENIALANGADYEQVYGERILEGKAADFYNVAMGHATPLTTYLDAFIASYTGRAKYTTDTRRMHIMRLDRWLRKTGTPTLEMVTHPLAHVFKDDLRKSGMKRHTVNKTLGSLRLYWKYLRALGHVTGDNPWAGVTVSKVESKGTENAPVRHYTDEELSKLLANAEDQDTRDAMVFAALTGARRGELFTLRFSDCADGVMLLQGSKNESSLRLIPIHAELEKIITRRAKGAKPSDFILKDGRADNDRSSRAGDAFGKRFSRLKTKLFNDQSLTFHSFRHWASIKMKLADVAGTKISDVLGHDHGDTTNSVYAAVQKNVRTGKTLDRISANERKIIREHLLPAIKAIKLPTT